MRTLDANAAPTSTPDPSTPLKEGNLPHAAIEPLLLQRLALAQMIGRTSLGIDDITVWAKERHPERKAPDYTRFEGWDFGAPHTVSGEAKMALDVLGIQPTANGRFNHSMDHLQELTDHARAQVPPWFELTLQNVTAEDLGRVIIGYGDPWNNGNYGAGPTRNPLRATYAVRDITILPDVEIRRFVAGRPVGRSMMDEIEARIAQSGFAPSSEPMSIAPVAALLRTASYARSRGGEPEFLTVYTQQVEREKTGLLSAKMSGDVILILSSGVTSGHAFVPAHARGESPLFGSLSSLLGNETKGVHAAASTWARATMERLGKERASIVPPGAVSHTTEAITVDNT